MDEPYQKYFKILDEIKNVQGTDEMLSKRICDLINAGALIEKDLVKLTEKHRESINKARSILFEINNKIGIVCNKLAILKMRQKNNE